MEISDLRSYLDVLRENGQLLTVDRPVDLRFELANILISLENRGLPAALFTSVGGLGIPVVGSLLSTQKRVALALGCQEGEVVEYLLRAMERPIPPEEVPRPAFQENTLTEEADLLKLPIPVHSEGDGGAFISGAAVFARDPRTGRQNISFQRFQLKGPKKLGININNWRHLLTFYEEAERRGEALPIAIAIGVDPAIHMAAGLRTEIDELHFAGALRGRPIRVARTEFTDIQVPAETEIVIEGDILPGVREEEGPLAEFTGHYSGLYQCPVVQVKAISHRHRPIFQTIVPASLEHKYLGNTLPREPLLLKFARHVSSGVQNVHIPPYGSGFLALISTKKKHPGEPKNLALSAMMTYVNIKIAIVLDPDVNLYNPNEVLWALSTRVDWAKDIFTVPLSQGHEMDPTSDARGLHTKVGIDATLSAERGRELKKVVYPDVDLSPFFGNYAAPASPVEG